MDNMSSRDRKIRSDKRKIKKDQSKSVNQNGIKNRYSQIIENIFFKHFNNGDTEVSFDRQEIVTMAKKLKIQVPKNLGDAIYSFRYRADLPEKITALAPNGLQWIIRPYGRGKYKFMLTKELLILPSASMVETKVLDATPGIIIKYSMDDEQSLLSKIRYNRLIDIFTSITCYSLQNHLRTTTKQLGQVETDEIYIGVDKRGAHYVLPVQAKNTKDRIGVVQIEQDLALCAEKFPGVIARPIAAQFVESTLIALFEFELSNGEVRVVSERHYRLVKPDELTQRELEIYGNRSEN